MDIFEGGSMSDAAAVRHGMSSRAGVRGFVTNSRGQGIFPAVVILSVITAVPDQTLGLDAQAPEAARLFGATYGVAGPTPM